MYHLNNVLKRGNKLTVLIIHTLPTYRKHFVDKRSRHDIICVMMVGKKKEICQLICVSQFMTLEYEKSMF